VHGLTGRRDAEDQGERAVVADTPPPRRNPVPPRQQQRQGLGGQLPVCFVGNCFRGGRAATIVRLLPAAIQEALAPPPQVQTTRPRFPQGPARRDPGRPARLTAGPASSPEVTRQRGHGKIRGQEAPVTGSWIRTPKVIAGPRRVHVVPERRRIVTRP